MTAKIPLYKSEIDTFLSNKELLSTFTNVKLSGNQKGRIRQNVLRDLQSFEENGRTNSQLIFSKIQGILNGHDENGALSDSDQRKLKILHNFLIAAAKKVDNPVKEEDKSETVETTKKGEKKKEKPKRYILFVGNLPTPVTSDEIKGHFKDIPGIVSVRIQKEEDDEKQKKNETKQKKNNKQLSRMFAHVELNDEFSYKLALTKHHTMLRNRRINILYSRDKTKIDKKTLKKKSLKVQFLNQSVGMSANKKRGLRRKKQLEAIRQAENA